MRGTDLIAKLRELEQLAATAKADSKRSSGEWTLDPTGRAFHELGVLQGRLEGLAENIGRLASELAASAGRRFRP